MLKLKLKELIELIDKNIDITVNRESLNQDLTSEMLDKDVLRIDIKTDKPDKPTLEDLGYSFEVGI